MALLKRKRVGLSDAMEVVTKFVNACNRHDADGVAACLHPDFDSIQPMYPSRNFRGADQVRRNWQAIFDAEPGFRLTVLRSASTDDTVWLELHGAGRDAEVAGIFIMGVTGDRIRWARIYSALVEPVVAGAGEASDPAASLPEVQSADQSPSAGGGAVVEEDLIAPVLDMERSTRRRRRRRSEDVAAQATTDGESVSETPEAVADAPDAVPEPVPDPADALLDALKEAAATESDPDVEVQVVEVAGADVEVVEVAEVAEVAEVVEAEADDPAVVVVEVDQAVDRSFDGGLDTESVPVIVWDDEPAAPAAEESEPEIVAVAVVTETETDPVTEAEAVDSTDVPEDHDPPVQEEEKATDSSKRRFGKRLRP